MTIQDNTHSEQATRVQGKVRSEHISARDAAAVLDHVSTCQTALELLPLGWKGVLSGAITWRIAT